MTKQEFNKVLAITGRAIQSDNITQIGNVYAQLQAANVQLFRVPGNITRDAAYSDTLARMKRNVDAAVWTLGMAIDAMEGARSELNQILEIENKHEQEDRLLREESINREIKEALNAKKKKTQTK